MGYKVLKVTIIKFIHMFFSKIRFYGMVVLIGVSPCGYAKEEEKPKVEVRLLCYKRVGSDTYVGAYSPQGKPLNKGESLKLPMYQLSDPIELSGRSFVFRTTSGKVAPQWNPKAHGASSVKLPSEGREFILLFVPTGTTSDPPYKIIPIVVPKKKFKGGAYLLINSTKNAIGGRFGQTKVELKPASTVILPPLRGDLQSSQMAVLHQRDGKTKALSKRPFLSFPLVTNTRKREVFIFFKNPRNGRMVFRGVQDPMGIVK